MQKTVQEALEASTGKTVQIDFQVDPSLIGGMVAQVGDISYDASVRTPGRHPECVDSQPRSRGAS